MSITNDIPIIGQKQPEQPVIVLDDPSVQKTLALPGVSVHWLHPRVIEEIATRVVALMFEREMTPIPISNFGDNPTTKEKFEDRAG